MAETLPDVTSDAEDESFVDLHFALTDSHLDDDGCFHFDARGRHGSIEVAFSGTLGASWEKQPVENSPAHFYWGSVDLRSMGEPSDTLLCVLDELYGIGVGRLTMADTVHCTAVGLNSDPLRAPVTRVSMKLFLDSSSSESPGEIFLNIDLPERRVELHEKDPEYRKLVLLTLSGQ